MGYIFLTNRIKHLNMHLVACEGGKGERRNKFGGSLCHHNRDLGTLF